MSIQVSCPELNRLPELMSGLPISAPDDMWYALHTRSNFEQRVADELMNKGLETFLPVVRELRQWKDRKKVITLPVFPGYVFVCFIDKPSIKMNVLKTSGVVRILGRGDRPEPIPESEINSIRILLSAKSPFSGHEFLKAGDKVRIKRGALKDVEGYLVRVKNQTRIVVSINLLSQSISAEVSSRDVEVIRTANLG
jgi:transcription antitermination factor NusG